MYAVQYAPFCVNSCPQKLPFFLFCCCCLAIAADGSELESVAPKGMTNVVARLEAFAGMSRMKRLALVVLCHTVTDKHLLRLKVGV